MTKSLIVLLDINMRSINDVDDRGLRIAEELFQTYGAPTERQALADALEKILLRLQSDGIPYPKILLLRRKQLLRGEWLPQAREARQPVQAPEPASKSEEELVAEARSVYTPAQFEQWLRNREQAKQIIRNEELARLAGRVP